MKKIKLFSKGKNVSFSLIEVIAIVIVTGIIVSISSGIIIYRNLDIKGESNNTSKDGELSEFNEVYSNIVNSYVQEVDKEALIEAAINAMFNYLGDDYSVYYDSDSIDNVQSILNGEYYGIGIVVKNNNDKNVEIVEVFDDTPAYYAGLKAGDVIYKVNEEDVTGKDVNYVVGLIKNSENASVTIEYERNKKKNSLEIGLANISMPIVSTKIYNDNIGYVKLSSFSLTAFDQFNSGLKELEKDNIKSLIIDLRNNSGGYLSAAYEIADLFIKSETPVYQLQKKDSDPVIYKSKDKEERNYKIAVLINGSSASASEVLALALKESYGASIIGVKSFGKGTVQEVEELSSGALVKYTTAYWLSPRGNSINKTGITPDIVVNNTTGNDEQLDKAIEELK